MSNSALSSSKLSSSKLSSSERPPSQKGLSTNPALEPQPSRSAKPNAVLNHPSLWQAGRLSSKGPSVASGYPELDQALLGGWPAEGLTELMLDSTGIGELQLLLPAMKSLSQTEQRWIIWINPPHRPCANTLRSYGIDIDKILLVHPKTQEEALWALEKALQSGSSAMALAWLDERQLSIKNSRRLQLAAKRGRCLSCLFRPSKAKAQPSMASARLLLSAEHVKGLPQGLQINVCKRRGGWPIEGLKIALAHPPVAQSQAQKAIQEQLLLWRDLNPQTHSNTHSNKKDEHQASVTLPNQNQSPNQSLKASKSRPAQRSSLLH